MVAVMLDVLEAIDEEYEGTVSLDTSFQGIMQHFRHMVNSRTMGQTTDTRVEYTLEDTERDGILIDMWTCDYTLGGYKM